MLHQAVALAEVSFPSYQSIMQSTRRCKKFRPGIEDTLRGVARSGVDDGGYAERVLQLLF